eukprot:g2608.t1
MQSVESSKTSRIIACWACRTTIELPKVNGEWASVFKCGWCGAITNSTMMSSKKRHGLLSPLSEDCCTRHSMNFIRITAQFGAVAFVVCLLMTMMCIGIFGLLPNAFSSPYTIRWSQILASFVAFNISINYILAAGRSSRSTSNQLPQFQGGTVPKGIYDGYRFCVKCQRVKAPDVHHCRVCNACIEEMDHHCPFIGNCVGKRNLRNFILFLIWTSIGAVYVVTVCIMLMIKSFPLLRKNHYQVISIWSLPSTMLTSLPWWCFASYYMFVVALGGGIGVSVLLATQLYQIWSGQNYIQQLQGRASCHKTEGLFSKLQRVFGGKNPLLWLFPFLSEKVAYENLDWKVL